MGRLLALRTRGQVSLLLRARSQVSLWRDLWGLLLLRLGWDLLVGARGHVSLHLLLLGAWSEIS